MAERNHKRIAALTVALGAGVVLSVIASILFVVLGDSRPSRRGARSTPPLGPPPKAAQSPDPGNAHGFRLRGAAEVSTALIRPYFEHLREHVPPYSKEGGHMQKRELDWSPPPANPIEFVQSKLKQSDADQALGQWVQACRAAWEAGAERPPEDLKELGPLLAKSSLDFFTMMEAGRAFHFLEEDAPNEHAVIWYAEAIKRAEKETANISPDDPKAVQYLKALQETAGLWWSRDRDWANRVLERRFALQRSLYPPLSPEGRRSAFLRAEMTCYMGQYDAAIEMLAKVAEEDKEAGDCDDASVAELHWAQGVMFYASNRFEPAIPHLRAAAANSHAAHGQQAQQLLQSCLVHAGSTEEALTKGGGP